MKIERVNSKELMYFYLSAEVPHLDHRVKNIQVEIVSVFPRVADS